MILDDPIYFIEDETWDNYEGPVCRCPLWCECECNEDDDE